MLDGLKEEDAAAQVALSHRFRYHGVGFTQFSLVAALCESISNGSADIKAAIAKFQLQKNKSSALKFVKEMFFLLVNKEAGGVGLCVSACLLIHRFFLMIWRLNFCRRGLCESALFVEISVQLWDDAFQDSIVNTFRDAGVDHITLFDYLVSSCGLCFSSHM